MRNPIFRLYTAMAERVLPRENYSGHPAALNRSKNILLFATVYIFCNILFGSFYFYSGSNRPALAIAAATFVIISSLSLLRSKKLELFCGHWIIFVMNLLLTFLAFTNGGYSAPFLAWLVSLPLAASALCGKKSGAWWFVIALSQIAIFYYVHFAGYQFPDYSFEAIPGLFDAFSLILLSCLVFIFARVYENLNDNAEKMIKLVSITDDLTQLYNRRGFFALAENQIKILARQNKPVMFLFVDVDNLKTVNDSHGHAAGDNALYQTAHLLKETLRGSDIICRIGGDEFAVMLTSGKPEDLDLVSTRVNQAVEEYNQKSGLSYALAITCGVFVGDSKQVSSLEKILDQADQAMYQNKGNKSFAKVKA